MSETRESTLKPIFVREYPPFALAMLVGNVASAVLGMRWLSKETKQVKI